MARPSRKTRIAFIVAALLLVAALCLHAVIWYRTGVIVGLESPPRTKAAPSSMAANFTWGPPSEVISRSSTVSGYPVVPSGILILGSAGDTSDTGANLSPVIHDFKRVAPQYWRNSLRCGTWASEQKEQSKITRNLAEVVTEDGKFDGSVKLSWT